MSNFHWPQNHTRPPAAAEFRLRAPDGTLCTGCNVAGFIKMNTARFDNRDLIKRDGVSLSQTRAYQGISGLLSGRYDSWKGWEVAR